MWPDVSGAILVKIQALLDKNAFPLVSRGAASQDAAVASLTLGLRNARCGRFLLSPYTTDGGDQFSGLRRELLELATLSSQGTAPPDLFTSICVNANFACALHRDANNAGPSVIAALGRFEGGELWVSKKDIETLEEPGRVLDVRDKWQRFDGRDWHATRPFRGNRVSLVYFVARQCSLAQWSQLKALGFPVQDLPRLLQLGVFSLEDAHCLEGLCCRNLAAAPGMLPFKICICSSRRALDLQRLTLRFLLDAGMPTSAMLVCVKDAEDARDYAYLRSLGVALIMAAGLASEGLPPGLPLQRRLLLSLGTPGEWLLFLDDDVSGWRFLDSADNVTTEPARFPEFVAHAFLTAERLRSPLWGCNPSQDARCLRLGQSRNVGLVCGYCWGAIAGLLDASLPISDGVGGAAEDIERSLRCFAKTGQLLRFPQAQILASTWSNEGGLQSSLGQARLAAHDYAVTRLALEFPSLLVPDASRPLRCRFLPNAGSPEVADKSEKAPEKPKSKPAPRAATSQPKPATPSPSRGSICCNQCQRLFRYAKDLRRHLLLNRCFSQRGRYPAAFPPEPQKTAAD